MKIEGLEHLKERADGRKRKEVIGVSNRGRVCKSWEISATAQNFIERERRREGERGGSGHTREGVYECASLSGWTEKYVKAINE